MGAKKAKKTATTSQFNFAETSSPSVAYTAASGVGGNGGGCATVAAHNNSRTHYKPKRFYKLRSFLRRFLIYLFPSCCGARYKHTIRRHQEGKRARIKSICWNCFPFCCWATGPAADTSSEDICGLIRNCGSQSEHLDIDQYVARYRQSEQLSAASAPAPCAAGSHKSRTPSASQSTTPEVHKKRGKKLIKHIWNWNDSLKSNSDSFLESLEYDAVHGGGSGGVGSKSNSLKKYRKMTNCTNIEGTRRVWIVHPDVLLTLPHFRLHFTEELAASPERAETPTKDAVSPTRSQASSKNEQWSSQSPSEDDIDRLVAMHRHRNSLSSLGVSASYNSGLSELTTTHCLLFFSPGAKRLYGQRLFRGGRESLRDRDGQRKR